MAYEIARRVEYGCPTILYNVNMYRELHLGHLVTNFPIHILPLGSRVIHLRGMHYTVFYFIILFFIKICIYILYFHKIISFRK